MHQFWFIQQVSRFDNVFEDEWMKVFTGVAESLNIDPSKKFLIPTPFIVKSIYILYELQVLSEMKFIDQLIQ